MDYNLLKALHIIFVVTWFAGLFYIVRLFVYIREAGDRPAHEQAILLPQLRLMAKRLWFGITWPSAALTLVIGSALIFSQPDWLQLPFMHVKLTFVFFLLVYQLFCQRLYNQLQQRTDVWSSMKFRIWNEVATLFLVSIVFLIVLKNTVDWLYGTLGLVIFAVLLMVAIRTYKHFRK